MYMINDNKLLIMRGILIKSYLAYKDIPARYKYIITPIPNMF